MDECETLQDAIAAINLRVLELEHLAIVETCTDMVESLRESKAALERDKQACSTFEGCARLQQQIDDLQVLRFGVRIGSRVRVKR